MKRIYLFMCILLLSFNMVAQEVDTYTITNHIEKTGDSAPKKINSTGWVKLYDNTLALSIASKEVLTYTILPDTFREIETDSFMFQMVNYDYATRVYGVHMYYSKKHDSAVLYIIESDLLTGITVENFYTIE